MRIDDTCGSAACLSKLARIRVLSMLVALLATGAKRMDVTVDIARRRH
jgi:hypothetical protein